MLTATTAHSIEPSDLHHVRFETPDLPVDDNSLQRVLADVEAAIPPLWPLDDYVAVNPFLGFTDQPFLQAHVQLGQLRPCRMLMPREYFRDLVEQGRLSRRDVAEAFERCEAEYAAYYRRHAVEDFWDWMASPASVVESERMFRTVAEAVDQRLGSDWHSHIVNDIARYCGAHYDGGQAMWSSPWKDQPLYQAWRNAACRSYRMDMLGVPEFRDFVAGLPRNTAKAIRQMLDVLEVPEDVQRQMLMCELFSIAGWASFIKYRVSQASRTGKHDEDLLGLLAIRLAYDVALAQTPGIPQDLDLWHARGRDSDPTETVPSFDVLARYVWQTAAEAAYRRGLVRQLGCSGPARRLADRKTLQMAFCIDVRSEPIRRHLEAQSTAIETFGFAGFFGLAFEYLPLGADEGSAQCPVLLDPGFRIRETLHGCDESGQRQISRARNLTRKGRKLWKQFQSSPSSCFSFVESFGITYLTKLITSSLGLPSGESPAEFDGVPRRVREQVGPALDPLGDTGIPAAEQIDLAAAILRNLGLTERMARVVLLCGHHSEVVNNPYRGSLDCGACGGHSGEPNARVAAALLNQPEVRAGLSERGIHIPSDTWFAAAIHNTTTDSIRICDMHLAPSSHAAELAQVERWLGAAGELARQERSLRLGCVRGSEVPARSRDWSQVRPEWGLAGNAAFLVAPRRRSSGLTLDGRTFMHSYDHRKDPEGKVLELIMTAPMIVTNWINLQYYASTVDHRAFGSGNKTIHNVVGLFGVFQGNGGDLMTGLPWQSVHDGRRYQHEPLRLLVVIDAPRPTIDAILRKHAEVRELVEHGWLLLMAIDDDRHYEYVPTVGWQSYVAVEVSAVSEANSGEE
ncbi:MAG: DUF2309 family protein [Pirellulaceae bacterium]|nr:DUF2309 family protein [Pirellulaceae bacterium]